MIRSLDHEQALSHLQVVELCNLVSGPYCTKLMADLGAEVIKIEPPGTGDAARKRGPFLKDNPHPELSGLFLHMNTNKLGVTLDIHSITGRKIFKELVKQVDILVEDNPPAVMEELGLTYKDLEPLNPRLIMTSITPFGQTGPYRDFRACELVSFHAGGEGYLLPIYSPFPDREPVKAGSTFGDCACGLSASLATLSAALAAAVTGMGQHIDISKQDVLMSLVQNHVSTYANLGEVHARIGKGFLLVLPMECRDGHVMMTIVSTEEWLGLIKAMGDPAWGHDERFLTWVGRHSNADEINPKIQEWVSNYTKSELFEKLQAHGVAAVPVMNAEDIANYEQFRETGFFREIDHPQAGRLRYPTTAYKFEATPWKGLRSAPLLGEHNQLVYCDRLGYSRDEVSKLRETGII